MSDYIYSTATLMLSLFRGQETKVITFALKMVHGINQNFQKLTSMFTCKSQSVYYASLFACMTSLTPCSELRLAFGSADLVADLSLSQVSKILLTSFFYAWKYNH